MLLVGSQEKNRELESLFHFRTDKENGSSSAGAAGRTE